VTGLLSQYLTSLEEFRSFDLFLLILSILSDLLTRRRYYPDDASKLQAIRHLNNRQGLPVPPPDSVIWNGALFQSRILNRVLFNTPPFGFTHPLSAYPREERYRHLLHYAELVTRTNAPRVRFIGTSHTFPDNLLFTVHTKEVNNRGYWTIVQRTVFLCREYPIVSIDIIAPSSVAAPRNHNNLLEDPDDIDYDRPIDLGFRHL